MRLKKLLLILLPILLFTACRKDEMVYIGEEKPVTPPTGNTNYLGFYLLNEGNMGMNGASIDYFNYDDGVYTTDFFFKKNTGEIKELGDVGNDIKIYGNKAYATINASNIVEVFNVKTGKHIKQIHVPNCRYIAFNNGKAYVSSYAGKIQIDPNAEIGFVAEIDTLSLDITRKVVVGYQPEEMVVKNNKLYVANSGGYRVPNYDTTVSVVDLTSFTEIKKIDVAINLHRMQLASNGDIYVSSRGDYNNTTPNLYLIDSKTDKVKKKLDIPVSNMIIDDNKLFFYATSYTHVSGGNKVTYGILDTNTNELLTDKIIKDGTDSQILIPYGIAVNPETKEIFMTDAQDYVGSGFVYCFSPEGALKWRTVAGNIPAHIAFIKR